MYTRLILLALLSLFLQACVTTNVGSGVSSEFDTDILGQGTLLVLDSKVNSYELGIAGAEEVPEWSEKSKSIVDSAVQNHLKSNTGLRLLFDSRLSEEQVEILAEHIALYELVAGQYLMANNVNLMPGWKQHRPELSSSLGPGLAFLKEDTGVDLAFLTIAEEYSSSGGRVAAGVAMAIIFGAAIPSGHSLVHLGIVDLETGELVWTNTAVSNGHSLADENGAISLIERAFSTLPKVSDTGQLQED